MTAARAVRTRKTAHIREHHGRSALRHRSDNRCLVPAGRRLCFAQGYPRLRHRFFSRLRDWKGNAGPGSVARGNELPAFRTVARLTPPWTCCYPLAGPWVTFDARRLYRPEDRAPPPTRPLPKKGGLSALDLAPAPQAVPPRPGSGAAGPSIRIGTSKCKRRTRSLRAK